ncbi:hypothetical protein L1987_40100 [Smallanthus sonchifolius]|uniref:Uncharacterized protein n=1 Tax=Smallanthus sonchifolius TaxID=185202 RepID=A0ACB9GS28_9ASTR|nr:hypothetical protein L1987_40100 [Smallanthus sonchifolius]
MIHRLSITEDKELDKGRICPYYSPRALVFKHCPGKQSRLHKRLTFWFLKRQVCRCFVDLLVHISYKNEGQICK